jgi:hypothetical protein
MMNRRTALQLLASAALTPRPGRQLTRRTAVAISGNGFLINGRPTYAGRTWRGHRIEGLLMNSRMVQGIFDDLNPATRAQWAYPDSGTWDPERNTREFIAAMPEWRRHGLLAFTVNLQGGSPQGYSQAQPWHNSAFDADGSLHPAYLARLGRVLDRADELGMVVILGYFYFGQDQRLADDDAVRRAVRLATEWLHDGRYRNVLIEIANECDNRAYDQPLIRADRVHELIDLAKSIARDGYRYSVSASFNGGSVPTPNVVAAADFVLLHGNGVGDPDRIARMVADVRAVQGYRVMPVLFNEDDHFDFEKPRNNCLAAVDAYASWGYFDYRMQGEGYDDGYQSVPVNWRISSARKRAFFSLVQEITGGR